MSSSNRREFIVSFKSDADFTKLDDLDVIIGVPDDFWPEFFENPAKFVVIFQDALIAAVRAIVPEGWSINDKVTHLHYETQNRVRESTNDQYKLFPLSFLREEPSKENVN